MENKFDIGEFVSIETEQKVLTDIVNRFKEIRKVNNISQKELSMRSGVSYGSIRRFESTGEISFSSLLKLAGALNCLEDFKALFKNKAITSLKDL